MGWIFIGMFDVCFRINSMNGVSDDMSDRMSVSASTSDLHRQSTGE